MEQQKLEDLFSDFDKTLTRLLDNEGELFAALLLQTYAWWRGEQIDLGLVVGASAPQVMHSDATSMIEHPTSLELQRGDADFIIVHLPCLFQSEYEARGKVHTVAEETHQAVQQEAKSRGVSEVSILLERFHMERAFLGNFLRE